jgi:DNA-binding beta-propeller fold protein YncE
MTSKLAKSSFLRLLLGVAALFLSLAAARADYIYVACQARYLIVQLDPAGNQTGFLSVRNPVGLAFDSSGNIYVSDVQLKTVTKYNSIGQGTVFASGFTEPHELAFDSHGNLFVADVTSVKKFAPDGTGSVFASGLGGAVALAIDPSNNVFVACFTDRTVQKLDSSGNRTVFASGLNSPDCLALDHNGNLYVGNELNNTILKFDAQGNSFLFATSNVAQPLGLTVDSENNLYVANAGPVTITKFDPSGNGTLFASSLPGGLRQIVALPFPLLNQCALDCPKKIVACANPGEHGTVVDFSSELVTNCVGFSIVCDPPSGSFFRLGNHNVNCWLLDQTSNIVDTCTFRLLVRHCPKNSPNPRRPR